MVSDIMTIRRALLGAVALFLGLQDSDAAERYISFGLGFGNDEIGAETVGINHPTRCDRLLYADPNNAPSDAACTDDTPRQIFAGAFEAGRGFVGTASIGQSWGRLRIEAELLARSHGGERVPAIPSAGNLATQGKEPEWSDHSPPYYEISNFSVRQLFVNLYYTFAGTSAWTSYVGAGVGYARVAADYTAAYQRRTVAEGYVAAAGGDPAQPDEWQLAAAGTLSLLQTEVDDAAFGYQVLAGAERSLSERAALFVTARWTALAEVGGSDVWTTIRSHAPVQADGATPFRTDQMIDDIGGFAATMGLRYTF